MAGQCTSDTKRQVFWGVHVGRGTSGSGCECARTSNDVVVSGWVQLQVDVTKVTWHSEMYEWSVC